MVHKDRKRIVKREKHEPEKKEKKIDATLQLEAREYRTRIYEYMEKR